MANKLLIIGDSFSMSDHESSWPNQLDNFEIHNLSMRGSSQYRLIKKLNSVHLNDYARVVFVHTSPNRIYVEQHPYYTDSITHPQCDLIFQDMYSRLPDNYAKQVTWWFENIFDLEQAEFVHALSIDYILSRIPTALHLTFFNYDHSGVENLHSTWQTNQGNINHMNLHGNQLVADFVKRKL